MSSLIYLAYRRSLEARALSAICPCWYYELADNIELVTDSELVSFAFGSFSVCQDCQ